MFKSRDTQHGRKAASGRRASFELSSKTKIHSINAPLLIDFLDQRGMRGAAVRPRVAPSSQTILRDPESAATGGT
jgi:hypothetical protein